MAKIRTKLKPKKKFKLSCLTIHNTNYSRKIYGYLEKHGYSAEKEMWSFIFVNAVLEDDVDRRVRIDVSPNSVWDIKIGIAKPDKKIMMNIWSDAIYEKRIKNQTLDLKQFKKFNELITSFLQNIQASSITTMTPTSDDNNLENYIKEEEDPDIHNSTKISSVNYNNDLNDYKQNDGAAAVLSQSKSSVDINDILHRIHNAPKVVDGVLPPKNSGTLIITDK